jgi:hypothetical protein
LRSAQQHFVGGPTNASDDDEPIGHTRGVLFPSRFILGARAEQAEIDYEIQHKHREEEDPYVAPRGGLPRLTTFEVTPAEIGPDGVRLDEVSRAKLEAAGADVGDVERALAGMRPGDRKMLAEVVSGTESDAPRGEVEEQLRWFGIAPTEEEDERIARGETVTFVVPGGSDAAT